MPIFRNRLSRRSEQDNEVSILAYRCHNGHTFTLVAEDLRAS